MGCAHLVLRMGWGLVAVHWLGRGGRLKVVHDLQLKWHMIKIRTKTGINDLSLKWYMMVMSDIQVKVKCIQLYNAIEVGL